jgi:hypothetical protein
MTGKTCSKLDGCPLPADHEGFCRAPESWRRADEPFMMTGRTPAELAELALTLHRAVARNDDPAISNGDSPYYRATSRALRVIVAQAYPDLDASEVYDVADDGGESIAHAAGYLRDQRAFLERERERVGGWVSGGMWSGSTLDDELARGDI